MEHQFGRVTRAQLTRLGVGRGQIESWLGEEYLHCRLPRVFAVGHSAPSVEAELFEAVLYAGPGAELSHLTGAWWRRLIDYPPPVIQVSTPRQTGSRPGIEVHRRRRLDRYLYRGIPVTSVPQTLLDLAAGAADITLVRKALGRLDYQHKLDAEGLLAMCRPGLPGSAALRWAVVNYDPRFGRTNGPLEDSWLLLCEREDVPKPDELNVWVHGIQCDALYLAQGLVIELDGGDNHGSSPQLTRDHGNDMILRSIGLQVNRYSWDLVHAAPRTVRADVLSALEARASCPLRPEAIAALAARSRRKP